MGKFERILDKMRNNQLDWRIEDLKIVARNCNITWRQPGTSHVTFRFANKEKLTVPAHKPIKPVYIKQFLILLDGRNKR